jgi:arginase
MPLACATGLARSQERGILDWIKDERLIHMKRLVYIGTRDVDDGEKTLIEKNGIKAFDMKNIQRLVSRFFAFSIYQCIPRHGIDWGVVMALEYVGGQTPIHLSCDIDVLDPKWDVL